MHVSNISSARLNSAKDAVERGQDVWVKVVSVSGGKLGLSIRDVDQATGRDLLDLEKIRAAQGTGSAAGGSAAPQSALQGISGIKVNPKDFEETTKRWALHCCSKTTPLTWQPALQCLRRASASSTWAALLQWQRSGLGRVLVWLAVHCKGCLAFAGDGEVLEDCVHLCTCTCRRYGFALSFHARGQFALPSSSEQEHRGDELPACEKPLCKQLWPSWQLPV